MATLSKIKRIVSGPFVRKTFIGAVIFLVVFSVVGFFVVPPVLKSILVKKLSENLHRSVTIREIKINPFVLSMMVRGFSIKERTGGGTFISFDELSLDLQSISVLKRGLILREVKLIKPYVRIERNEDSSYNFSDLLQSEGKKEKRETKKPRVFLGNIQILGGGIDFHDDPKQVVHKVRDMNINLPFISSLPYYVDVYVEPSFEARVNGTPVSFKGKTKPFRDSLETHFDINIKDLDIPFYLAYSPFKMPLKVPSALLDANTDIAYIQYKDRPPALTMTGNVAFKKIKVVDLQENPLISLPALEISFAPSDLIAKKIHLAKVFFDSPEIQLARDRAGRVNLQSLVPERGVVLERKEESPILSVDADEIKLTDGKISIADFLPRETFRTVLENIEVKIDHFSNGKDKKSAVSLSLETEAKESVRVRGELSVIPVASEGTVELSKVPLKKYAPYYSSSILFDVEGGKLDLSTGYQLERSENGSQMRLARLSAALSSLRLRKRGEKEDFLNVPSLALKGLSADLAKRELVIGEVASRNGRFKLRRDGDGKLNVQTLVPKLSATTGKPQATKKETKKEKEWAIELRNLIADHYTVQNEDLAQAEPVNVIAEGISLKCSNLSTARNAKGRASLAFVLNKNGSVRTSGTVGINPPAATMTLDVKGLEIVPFQSYFTDFVKIMVTQGNVSLNGAASAGYSEGGAIKASFKGEASLLNFASVDKANGDDFLKWNSLRLDGMDAGYSPLSLSISQVALTDFYSRLIINKDGSINLQGILKGKEEGKGAPPANVESGSPAAKTDARPVEAPVKEELAEPEKPAEPAQPKPPEASRLSDASPRQKPEKLIKIDAVTLQGGTINFLDRHIEPNYSANLLEIGGRVSGLSSEEDRFADVELRGKFENYAPLEITGKINPLRDDLYVDLKVGFKDMDLSPVTPYSDRYLGYTVQKGKLSLNLQYLIVKKKLDSQNKVFLDQFTLGEQVESPNATKLPVSLAIALLKDRKGEINLDIPVSGYIDDPKFRIGRIIIQILVNLISKAATSPFALLGAILGSGEELSYVEFDDGSLNLGEQGLKKLDALAKALFDRPTLKLEIEGHVDVQRDREGLKQYLFEKKLKFQKLKDMVKKGQPSVSVDEIKIEKDEYAKYLKMAYKEEKFPKPRNIIGFAKDLPVPEMEKLMLSHIEIKNEDLRQLASQRALKVKEYLLKSGQIAPERVFLIEPKSLEPEKKEKLKSSRVDFRLK